MTPAPDAPAPSALGSTGASRKSRFLRALARLGSAPTRPLAGRRWFPLWAVLHHVGRTSGRHYAIPVAIQRTEGGFLIPVPFGDATQWVRNVLAAGSCTIRWRGRDHVEVRPRVLDRPQARPEFDRAFSGLIPATGIKTFLRVDDADA